MLAGAYDRADFPGPAAVFRHYAANVGKASDWGHAPLSVPDKHKPSLIPLKVGYESRPAIDRLMAPLGDDKQRALLAATLGLAQLLEAVHDAIEPRIALTLAFETVNGMAKTAPMTAAAMKVATES